MHKEKTCLKISRKRKDRLHLITIFMSVNSLWIKPVALGSLYYYVIKIRGLKKFLFAFIWSSVIFLLLIFTFYANLFSKTLKFTCKIQRALTSRTRWMTNFVSFGSAVFEPIKPNKQTHTHKLFPFIYKIL